MRGAWRPTRPILGAEPHVCLPPEGVETDMPNTVQVPTQLAELERLVAILGVPFHQTTLPGAVDSIAAMVAEGGTHYVVTPNVDFLVKAQRDPELRRILVHADLVLCDGKPIVWASHLLSGILPSRVAGSDLTPLLLDRAAAKGWRLFLLGGSPAIAAEAARRIALTHPTLQAVAHYSPPYAPLDEMDNAEIFERIRAAKPDIMLVCFGCPKQEKWISRNLLFLDVPVMIAAGATVDFLAGSVARAPTWMRRSGTEWVFRLIQEPRRLARRYADDLVHFFPAILLQKWRQRPARSKSKPRRRP
jgi:N-acetylglucosaminyldiphosphoundecaprenol N-acetyl-beta-D-mannosaminyltransferase